MFLFPGAGSQDMLALSLSGILNAPRKQILYSCVKKENTQNQIYISLESSKSRKKYSQIRFALSVVHLPQRCKKFYPGCNTEVQTVVRVCFGGWINGK